MDKISILGEASGSSRLPKRRIHEVSEEPLSPSCWTGCGPSVSDRELSVSQPSRASDQEKLLMACVDLSRLSYSKLTSRRDTQKTNDFTISSFAFSLSLSPSLHVSLSLNIFFQEEWPAHDKQKEKDLLSSFYNSPVTLFLSHSLAFSSLISHSPLLHPALSLSFFKSPSPKNKILLTLRHLLISTI